METGGCTVWHRQWGLCSGCSSFLVFSFRFFRNTQHVWRLLAHHTLYAAINLCNAYVCIATEAPEAGGLQEQFRSKHRESGKGAHLFICNKQYNKAHKNQNTTYKQAPTGATACSHAQHKSTTRVGKRERAREREGPTTMRAGLALGCRGRGGQGRGVGEGTDCYF